MFSYEDAPKGTSAFFSKKLISFFIDDAEIFPHAAAHDHHITGETFPVSVFVFHNRPGEEGIYFPLAVLGVCLRKEGNKFLQRTGKNAISLGNVAPPVISQLSI